MAVTQPKVTNPIQRRTTTKNPRRRPLLLDEKRKEDATIVGIIRQPNATIVLDAGRMEYD